MLVNHWMRISIGLKFVLMTIAISFLGLYIGIALIRIPYPFELEWMEGGAVEHVSRILFGLKLYVKPSLEFTPFIYNPLYFYVAALVSKVVSVGFFPLRLVSFISSLGCFIVIYLLVKKETSSAYCAVLSGCLFAATYKISGVWFDIARVDSLFLLLFLVGIYIIRLRQTNGFVILAAMLFSLSYFCKQPALLMSIPLVLYFWLQSWRLGLLFTTAMLMFIAVPTLWLDWLHDGWYSYYIFYLPRRFPISEPHDLIRFWTNDLALPLAIGCATAVFYFLFELPGSIKRNRVFYLLTTAGMLTASWVARVKLGGHGNVLFPAYAAISVLFGIGLYKVLQFVERYGAANKEELRSFIFICCIIQFMALAYNPMLLVPSQKDKEVGQKLVQTLERIPGDVFVPSNPHLAVMAGKNSYALAICMRDIARGDPGGKPAIDLANQIYRAVAEHKFAAVVTNQPEHLSSFPFETFYTRQRPLFEDTDVFWTVTGFRSRPSVIWVPKE